MKNQFAGKKIIVGVDRLDYTKGIPHRLYAIERLLSNYPQWLGKVILLQIAVPSRTDVKEYQRLSKEAHELVGIINGKYGSLTYSPINFLDQSIPFERLCALYHIGDVCICTSLRDGMNLVSFEYVACQKGKNGVLVLSEFAGSAQSLGAGCIRINPWDVDEVAAALNEVFLLNHIIILFILNPLFYRLCPCLMKRLPPFIDMQCSTYVRILLRIGPKSLYVHWK